MGSTLEYAARQRGNFCRLGKFCLAHRALPAYRIPQGGGAVSPTPRFSCVDQATKLRIGPSSVRSLPNAFDRIWLTRLSVRLSTDAISCSLSSSK
jgi:hypothetical protein